MNEIVDSKETLYRRIYIDPCFWKTEEGRPTSAAFKDPNGLSVNKKSDRLDKEVVNHFFEYMDKSQTKAIVGISAKHCIDINAIPLSKPTDENKFHAEIHDSVSRKELSKGKARNLAKNCSAIFIND